MLVSSGWDEQFPNSHLRCLGSDASDHCPLLLHTNMGSMSKSRFHFELFLPKFPDYDQVITESWQAPFAGQGAFVRLDGLLRRLVKDLQRWAATRISYSWPAL